MINKKFFLKLAMVSMLAILPINHSVAEEQILDEPEIGQKSGFYVKGFYNLGKVASSDFNATYAGGDKLYANYTADTSPKVTGKGEECKPEYDLSKKGGGIAIGYQFNGNIRLELEGIAAKVETKPSGQIRGLNEGMQDYSYAITDRSNIESIIKSGQNDHTFDGNNPIIFKNSGFTYVTGLLNIYYDLVVNNFFIKPHIGVGVGIMQITQLGFDISKDRVAAFQGKAGITAELTENFKLHGGYRFIMHSESSHDLKSNWVGNGAHVAHDAVDQFGVNLKQKHPMHNLEAGVMLSF